MSPYVAAYEAYTARREPGGVAGPGPMGILPHLLDLLGDVAGAGVPVPFYHRTLADYLDAFLDAALRLTRV